MRQFRDPRVQSVLDYPPPRSAPLFWFLSKEPCMQSPNLCLSPEPCFARNGCTSFKIQGSKVCSTIRPLPLRHCFGFFQRAHVCKAPTSIFHHRLDLPGMVAPVSRSKGRKCAPLSPPSLCATVLVSFKRNMYAKPQPGPYTRALIGQEKLHQFRDARVQSVLDYPPPPSAPLFLASFKGPVYGKHQLVPFNRALICQEWLHPIRDPEVQSVLHYPPPPSAPLFWFLSRGPCMESPN